MDEDFSASLIYGIELEPKTPPHCCLTKSAECGGVFEEYDKDYHAIFCPF
jgi:hypothetical protein